MRHRYEFTLNDKDSDQAKIVELLSHMGGMRSGFIKSLLSAYVARYGTQIPGVSDLFDGEPIHTTTKSEKTKEVPAASTMETTEQGLLEPKQKVAPEPMPEKEPDPIPEPVVTVPVSETQNVATGAEHAEARKPDKAFLSNALSGLM